MRHRTAGSRNCGTTLRPLALSAHIGWVFAALAIAQPIPGVQLDPKEVCFQRLISWEEMLSTAPSQCGARGQPSGRIEEVNEPATTGLAFGSAVAQPPTCPSGTAAAAPYPGLGFKGMASDEYGFAPPDSMGAIGPNHFVEIINGSVAIYSRASGLRVGAVCASAFFPGGAYFDPRLIFDQFAGRWVAMALLGFTTPNQVLVAVSLTDDPTGDWFQFCFGARGFADYPFLGLNADGIYVQASNAAWAIDKGPLLLDPPRVGAITYWSVVPGGARPTHSRGDSSRAFFVGKGHFSTLQDLVVFELQGPPSSPTLSQVGTVPIPIPFHYPAGAPALGSSTNIETGLDGNIQAAVYRSGSVWTCYTVLAPDTPTGRNACRWYEIDVSNPSNFTLRQCGTVTDSTLHFYYPSLAVNAQGDVVMAFSGSSATEYVGVYFTGRRHDDPLGQMAAPRLLKNGEAAYNYVTGGRQRWGDYSATTVDPTDESTFWTVQEYARSSDRPNVAGIWVGALSFDGFDCNSNGIQDAQEIAEGTSADCLPNGIPDECEPDCNTNGTADACDLSTGASQDCNRNLRPDECEPQILTDCNSNGAFDVCESGGADDCNTNGIFDVCDIFAGTSNDCNLNARPDECDPNQDCNSNGVQDVCDIAAGISLDCNLNATPDECDGLVRPAACVVSAASFENLQGARGLAINWGGRVENRDVTSEPRSTNLNHVRIAFDQPLALEAPQPVLLLEQGRGPTCPGGTQADYTPSAQTIITTASGNELAIRLSSGLANARTYKFAISDCVTSIPGQWIEIRALAGDANSDGQVNGGDRSRVVAVWTGPPPRYTPETDIIANGVTDALDRSEVINRWTSSQNCAP